VRFRWTRVAADEAREARLYYESEKAGLGAEFVDELRACIDRIDRNPLAWPQVETPVRRTLVNRFPYLVHYVVDDEQVLVLGVYHARRKPVSWTERLSRDV
jgi:plasmid stabilization system protein ParE